MESRFDGRYTQPCDLGDLGCGQAIDISEQKDATIDVREMRERLVNGAAELGPSH